MKNTSTWAQNLPTYNGEWTNQFTWAMHLVAFDQSLEAQHKGEKLAHSHPDDLAWSGRELEAWVREQVARWFDAATIPRSATRGPYHADMELLVHQMKGDSLGHINWEDFCNRLFRTSPPMIPVMREPENPFTDVLARFVFKDNTLYPGVEGVFNYAFSHEPPPFPDDAEVVKRMKEGDTSFLISGDPFFRAVDAVHDYFDRLSDDWISLKDVMRHANSPMTHLMKELAEVYYTLVDWTFIAEALRAE